MAENGRDIENVTLTIDGQEVTFPKGTTILQAAQGEGTEIPHYCYHPGLSSPAMCRLCLVEVEGAPKLRAHDPASARFLAPNSRIVGSRWASRPAGRQSMISTMAMPKASMRY